MASRTPHVDAAHDYAKRVVAGKIPACKWVKLACRRHLNDLRKSTSRTSRYYFDPEEGERPCVFIENLPHVKGQWARDHSLIKLEPWECFLIAVLFGWRRRRSGRRRFTETYWEICRKNGKSILAAAIGLYMLTCDGESGAEVYCGATTEKQAWFVFGPARLMAEKTPDLIEHTGLEVFAKSIVVPSDHSKFEPVIGKPGDGASPSCAIVDEFHEHDTSEMVDTMQTGMGSREQPILLIITTAGFNLAGPCYEKRRQAAQMLDGVIPNDELFAIIYSIDEKDDWTKPAALRKANPNMGVSVDEDFLLTQQRNAVMNVALQNAFKTKHLNIWCAARSGWMSQQMWAACGDSKLKIEQFKGVPCFFSLDLGSKSDLLAFMQIFVKEINGAKHYYVFGRYYLPDEAVLAPGKNQAAYRVWHKQGLLTVTPGATTDFETVCLDVQAMAKIYTPAEVVFDPFNATMPAQALMDAGLTLTEFTQKPANFAVPMDEILTAAKDGRLHHDANDMLAWMMNNVEIRPAKKGLFWPTKGAPDQKIDGPVAMIMGIARASESDGKGNINGWLESPVIV
jgi:phage terminase large subunit-like protein